MLLNSVKTAIRVHIILYKKSNSIDDNLYRYMYNYWYRASFLTMISLQLLPARWS